MSRYVKKIRFYKCNNNIYQKRIPPTIPTVPKTLQYYHTTNGHSCRD